MQVFGRRQRRSNPPVRRPASEKRQGTKSREVSALPCRRAWGAEGYGDLGAELEMGHGGCHA